ncbi:MULTISPECIES: hypothetical protein [Actinomycetes]|uniref:Uncharacterized protein n=1 Tax=Streptomyces acidiscabies TaxID=42234 RepID=A0ABU4ME31_9ACTN|nr:MULTISPECIES: hypothetical protein [Actinomycetes]MDX2973473.1 hypothetical protein [Kribbella solani]MDX3007054.1 hypothetical protein [Kribbella solani]MDX3026087.1 hypothetical protein [Streptomyces acidiscabies]
MADRAVIDKHTGWTCETGASLIASANSPGKGTLPDLNASIYVCADHRAEAEALITAAGYDPETDPAPPGHKWNPWPCGTITAHSTEAADALGCKFATFTAARLVRYVALLADYVGRQGITQLADELAAAAKVLQYRYDAPAWQGRNGTKPDSGIPAVDLMRRVRWEGNGFLAVSVEEIRRTYNGPEPLEEQLAGHNLLTLPRTLPPYGTARVLLYTGLSQISHLLTATEEDGAAVVDELVEAVRRSRLPSPHPMDF